MSTTFEYALLLRAVLQKATAHTSPILIGLLLLSQDVILPSLPLLILGSITDNMWAILGAHAKSLLSEQFSKVINTIGTLGGMYSRRWVVPCWSWR
jgi:hypothetical protein